MKHKLAALTLVLAPFTSHGVEFDVQAFLNKTYIEVGVGYKFDELTINFNGEKWDDPYSARIEMGYNITKHFVIGISHHSQWATGFPLGGSKNEYYKTEIFAGFRFNLGEIL